jgi:hypothetical protein
MLRRIIAPKRLSCQHLPAFPAAKTKLGHRPHIPGWTGFQPDLALPDLSGDQLAARALDQQPGLRVVFASGYEALPPSAKGFGGTVLLQKPYDERSLAEALSAVMEASLA